MSRGINPFGLRMPDNLRASLQAAADAEGRSLNAEIVRRLLSTLENTDMTAQDFHQFKFRLPIDLFTELKKEAEYAGRSITAHIIWLLEKRASSKQTPLSSEGERGAVPMNTPVAVLTIGVEAAIDNCAYHLRHEVGLTQAADQMDAAGKAVSELIEAGNNVIATHGRDLEPLFRLKSALARMSGVA